jgi:endo-1,4-beta-xylanase
MRATRQLVALLLAGVTAGQAAARCGDDPGDQQAVAEARTQVNVTCDCFAAATHRDYVACAVGVADQRVAANLLPSACRATVKRCAAKSVCGKPGYVTCCRTTRSGKASCRIKKSPASCTPPAGGTARLGAFVGCCDACSVEPGACPAVSTTTTAPPVTTTTTTLPPGTVTLRSLADDAGILIGASAQSIPLAGEPPYADTLAREFNHLSPDYELIWGNIHPALCGWNFDPVDAIVDFAAANGLRVQGTPLVWYAYLPDYVSILTPAGLRAALEDHVRTVVGRYRGRVASWVVVNEAVQDFGPPRPSVFLDRLGPGYIGDAFRWAHEADPDALLFYNDYRADGLNAKSDAIYGLVQGLLQDGVPIHGVGLQMHLGGAFGSLPATVRENMQRFVDLGLLVQVTEMDFQVGGLPGTLDERLAVQRGVYHDVVADCLAVAGCRGVTAWGFTDKYTWIDQFFGPGNYPLLFDAFYQPKPSYFGVQDALAGH